MSMTDSLAKYVGIKPACDALVVSRAGFYRWKNQDEEEALAAEYHDRVRYN